jgi:hypothetical protein
VDNLPLKSSLGLVQRLSILVALLMAAASLAGLLFPAVVYPTADLRHAFLANDVVNLFIGLPVLLGALWTVRKGSLRGLLFLPGALFYVTYNAIAYACAMPLTWQFGLFLTLAILSGLAITLLFSRLDIPAIGQRLSGKVAERLCGGVLAGFGALFFLRGIAQLAQGAVSGAEGAVVLADLFTAPFWIIGGILLWRKHPLGYASGAGLLFQASMLFVGLLMFFILQPIVSSIPFPLADFVVILVMGLIVFVPFGMFVSGVQTNQIASM